MTTTRFCSICTAVAFLSATVPVARSLAEPAQAMAVRVPMHVVTFAWTAEPQADGTWRPIPEIHPEPVSIWTDPTRALSEMERLQTKWAGQYVVFSLVTFSLDRQSDWP